MADNTNRGGDSHAVDLTKSIDQKEYDHERTFVRSVETLYYDLHDRRGKIYQDEPRVIKGDEIPFRGGMRMWNKNLVHPGMDPLWTQSLHVHVKEMVPQSKSQRHYHQNEAVMYILNGKGYEIFDDEKYTWEAGDIVTIPGGCVHQHFAAEDCEVTPRVLISKPKPLCLFLNLHFQQQIELPNSDPVEGWEDHDPNAEAPYMNSPRADGHGLPLPEDWDAEDVLVEGHSIQHHGDDNDSDHGHQH